tara:strand:+ start:297 stop:494 length:198 start_codon:yes stop_codon:yes gene_type:complete
MIRSVERDVKAMSLGLDLVNSEIKALESLRSSQRSVKKRLERLRAARQHLIDNPEDSQKLIDRLN